MKLLALADLQLGAGKHLAPGRLSDQENILHRIADLTRDEHVDAVLLAGDVYEDRQPTREEDEVFADWLASLTVPVLACLGNHDWRGFERASTVKLFQRLGLRLFERPDVAALGGCAVAFLPWIATGHLVATRNGGDRDALHAEAAELLLRTAEGLRADCEQVAPDLPALLVTHWWIEGAGKIDSRLLSEPVLPLAGLADLSFDAVIGGHVHDAAVLNEGPTVVMCGSPYVCDWGEAAGEHGVWIVDTDAADAPRFVRLADRPFVTWDVDFTHGDDFSMILEGYEPIVSQVAEGGSARVRYTATREQRRRVDEAAVRAALHAAGAARVQLEWQPVREERARVAAIDETLGPIDSLNLYLDHHQFEETLSARMRERTAEWLADLGASGDLAGGGRIVPRRLTLENVATFARLDLELPSGCTVIAGANGAGKSTIVNSIERALFAGRGELADWLSRSGAGDLAIVLQFTVGDVLYRVRRGYSLKGKTTLDLEKHILHPDSFGAGKEGGWLPLSRDKAAETQAYLEQLLALSRDTFNHSAFGAQNGLSFADQQVTPAQRKEILAEALGLAVWAQLLEKARAARKTADLALAAVDAKTATLREQIAAKPDEQARLRTLTTSLQTAEQALAKAEADLETATAEHEQAKTAAGEIDKARAHAQAAEAEFQRLDATVQDAAAARGEEQAVADALDRLAPRLVDVDALAAEEMQLRQQVDQHAALAREHDARLREYDLKRSQRSAILGQANDLNEKAYALRQEAAELEARGPGTAHCDQCGQTLGAEALASTLAAKRTQADELDAAAKDLDAQAAQVELPDVGERPSGDAPTADLAHATRKLEDAREAQTEKRILDERLVTIHDRISKAATGEFTQQHREAGDKLVAARARVAVLAEAAPTAAERLALEDAVVAVRDRIADSRRAVTETTSQKAVVEERLARVADAEQKLVESDSRRAELQDEIDLGAALEKVFGRDGIPVFIIETAIPQFEDEANVVLQRLPLSDGRVLRVELRTQAELKDGSGLRETLDVVVIDPDGNEAPYHTCSGGEETRVSRALRVGLALLLSHRRGAEVAMLVLDEPDALDEAGMNGLVSLLRELAEKGRFEQIFLISHVPALQEAFDQVLHVVKDDGRSRVVEHEPAEAVAA